MKKNKKFLFVLLRWGIKKIEFFSPREYMKYYCWYLRKIGIDVKGTPRFIHPSVMFDGMGYENTHIGDNVVISRNVLFLVHDYSITCGFRAIRETVEQEAFWLKDITIGNNVFIGANVTVLPGTIIEDNCIIGAGSVVKGHIESNSIAIGNPCKKMCSLDEWARKKELINDYIWN